MLTSVLAEHNLAYRGTLKTMNEWLGLKSNSVNNARIKDALKSLTDKEYLIVSQDGRTYTISITNKGLKDKQVRYVRKCWIKAFKQYNYDKDGNKIDKYISLDWINTVKVFVYILTIAPGSTVPQKEIADELSISADTVSKAINCISNTELKGYRLAKDIVKQKYQKDGIVNYKTVGTEYNNYIVFDEI